MDSISECKITRFLANIRSLLDDYGKTHAVNSRSSIRVDEDYWYMRGKYMCDKESDKGWPCSSVVNVRLQNTIPLNTTLTSTNISYDRTGIECLKKLLFKDCHEARSELLQLRIKGKNRQTLERNEKLFRGLLVVHVGISVVHTMKTFRICYTKKV